jgi:hypothetical protein
MKTDILSAARRVSTISAFTVGQSRDPAATRLALAKLEVLLGQAQLFGPTLCHVCWRADVRAAYNKVCICLGREYQDG